MIAADLASAQTANHGVGVQFTVSTLGLGGQAAVALSDKFNLRGGFNAFQYGRTFNREGVDYDGTLKLRSGEAIVDIFPTAGAWHISPGVLFYNDNRFDAVLTVPDGDTFELGNDTYRSNPANPLRGGGNVTVNRVAPMVLFGWGNLVPKTKRWVLTFESGVAFHGTPKARLNFSGSVCDVSGQGCGSTNDPDFQASIREEERTANEDARPFKVWPVVRLGVGFRF